MKTYFTHRDNENDTNAQDLLERPRKGPVIAVLNSYPPQLRVNGTIIPWPQGTTPQEAYEIYLRRQAAGPQKLPQDRPTIPQNNVVPFQQMQTKELHPLRWQYLENRLRQINYMQRQQAHQDDFTTRMYGRTDFAQERGDILNELNSGKQSRLPNSQTNDERFWDSADRQTAQNKYPHTPPAVGQEISRYQRQNPNDYAANLKKWQEDQKTWQEIDQDIKDGTLSKQDISPAQWDTILRSSQQELEDKQNPQKNINQEPYCNIYARDRLLQQGIYMEPGKNANQMIEDMNKKDSEWEKLPKKTDADGKSTGKLDHQEAQRRAEAGGTVVATYHSPNNTEHGHIVLVNPDAGMKDSNNWGGKVPSVDGYSTDIKQITEGDSLSKQFSTQREPHMDYYEYKGSKRTIHKE